MQLVNDCCVFVHFDRPSLPRPIEPSPCEHCGGPRSFELQLVPTLLHFLHENANANAKSKAKAKVKANSNANANANVNASGASRENQTALPAPSSSSVESASASESGNSGESTKSGAKAGAKSGAKSGAGAGSVVVPVPEPVRNTPQTVQEQVDWGMVAVYACQDSCGGDCVLQEQVYVESNY